MKAYSKSLVVAALLSSADAHKMFPKLLVGFHPQDQSMVQLRNEGIFDKAAVRIAKEEDEKAEAIQKL